MKIKERYEKHKYLLISSATGAWICGGLTMLADWTPLDWELWAIGLPSILALGYCSGHAQAGHDAWYTEMRANIKIQWFLHQMLWDKARQTLRDDLPHTWNQLEDEKARAKRTVH